MSIGNNASSWGSAILSTKIEWTRLSKQIMGYHSHLLPIGTVPMADVVADMIAFHTFRNSYITMAKYVPVPFADLGKPTNDLLGKDFPVGQTKFELKTVAPNGVVCLSCHSRVLLPGCKT